MKTIYLVLSLAMLVLNGCTGAVVGIDNLEGCWNERAKLQSNLAICNQEKAAFSCQTEEIKLGLLQDRINELENTECPACVCQECSETVCDVCENQTVYINDTIYVNQTQNITVYLNNCTEVVDNETNSTA